MNCAKNCENLLNFVKVIPKTLLVPFFSGHVLHAKKNSLVSLLFADVSIHATIDQVRS